MVAAMAGQTREPKLRVDADGVRIYEVPGVRARVWLVVIAAVIVVALLLVVRGSRRSELFERVAPVARSAAPPAPAGGPRVPAQRADARPPLPPRVPAVPDAPAVPPNAAAADSAAADEPRPHEPMFGGAASGEPSGVALFPPPGTKPIKRGLVVPDDFDLPPGYVRHYQATDDGERVPAILMFHPDYHPVDEHGDPIALPADRIVPPDMAPPGMPIEMLELEEPNTDEHR
jgi:hypothetical protein